MKIAIVKLSALGDIIHTMVVLQFIKKQLPDVLIDWVIEAEFADILSNNPNIYQIHKLNLKQAKRKKSLILLFKEFKKLTKLPKYDMVIDIQGLLKSAIVTKLIPGKQTWGFDKHSIREPLAAKFYLNTCKIDYAQNIVKRNIALISVALKITVSDADLLNKQPFLYTNHQLFNLPNNAKPNVALIVGGSSESKIYPAAQYAQLAQTLNANVMLIWGNLAEKRMAQQIQKIAPKTQLADKLSLNALKILIKQMDLVIGADTGPSHMAWALNIASITLFSATPSTRNTYVTDINRVLESNSQVNPYKIDKNDFSIKNIKVADIASMAKQLLSLRV